MRMDKVTATRQQISEEGHRWQARLPDGSSFEFVIPPGWRYERWGADGGLFQVWQGPLQSPAGPAHAYCVRRARTGERAALLDLNGESHTLGANEMIGRAIRLMPAAQQARSLTESRN